MTQQPTAAEIRLAQYAQRPKTWSTATYDNGTEKALHEIALGLKAEIDRLRADLTTARNHIADLEAYALGCDGEGCTVPHSSWCEVAKKTAAENGGCTCPQPWKDSPQPHAGYCWLVSPPRDEVERMRARIAELLAAASPPAV